MSCGSTHYRKGLARRWEQHARSTSLQNMQLAPGFSSKDTGTKEEHENHGPSGVVGVSAPGRSVPCLTCIMTSEKVRTAAAQPTVVPRHSSPPRASMTACHSCPHALRGCFCSCHSASSSCRCQVVSLSLDPNIQGRLPKSLPSLERPRPPLTLLRLSESRMAATLGPFLIPSPQPTLQISSVPSL